MPIDKEEALSWLQDFMKEVNEQDNRMTATPVYYTLYDPETHRSLVGYNCVFLTQRMADEYLEYNSHNLPEGTYTYLQCGNRNPELKQMFEAIGTLVGIPYINK